MKSSPMPEVEQGATRRVAASGAARRSLLLSWKVLTAVGVLIGTLALWPMRREMPPPPAQLSYTALLAALDGGQVGAIDLEPGYGVRGRWKSSAAGTVDFVAFYTIADATPLLERAERTGTIVTFRRAGASQAAGRRLALGAQIGLVAGVFVLLIWVLRHQLGGRTGVGRKASGSTTTFADVAGTQGAAEELREVVSFLRSPAQFAALGARVPKGVLLVGPPGTGKTLMARAVAGEARVPFFFISGSEVTGFIVGLGAQRIRRLFRTARKRGGVVFIDELDALGGARGRNRSHNEDDRTLNQLLVEMDGFAPTDGVIVIAATNRPEDLDPALKRPGRFDRIVAVALPTVDGREEILRLHAASRAVPLAKDVELRRLAQLTTGASGAELANLLNEAAIAAARARAPAVTWQHVEQARDRMLLGKERVGFRAPDREWRIVAVHEAGHALAGVVACPEDELHKITIQARGQAMGVAHFAPEDDRHLYSRRYLEAQIIKGLGGRVAEELVFGPDQVTGGAESDLVHVNRVARRMIHRLGMGVESGLLVQDEQAGGLSAAAQARMDAEVQDLLRRLHQETRAILERHRPALDALAAALLERETLDRAEALALLETHGVAVAAATLAST